MSRPSEYTPDDYDAMFADPERTEGYLKAIARVVQPGDVVVEIGTGVGYFAVAACRAGARMVYAIESEPSILLAEQVLRENGCDGKVRCIRGDANRITLPERGTVLISDLRGVLPVRGDGIPTLMNARQRLLVRGARLIPRRDTILGAPCEAPRRWAEVELTLGRKPRGIARSTLAKRARSTLHRMRVDPSTLCAVPAEVATIDYQAVATPDIDATASWTIDREAQTEGIALWFDAELAEGAGFSTSPHGPKTMYSHAFLPFERSLACNTGDRIDCRLRMRLMDGSYVISWDTVVRPALAAHDTVQMRQSTLGTLLMTPEELARRRADFRPNVNRTHPVRELLDLADGTRTMSDIATAIAASRAGRFSNDPEALAWVTRRIAELYDLGDS